MVWFRRHIRLPDKGLGANWRWTLGSNRACNNMMLADPPFPIRPVIRRFYKRAAAKRQRQEDRLACRNAALRRPCPD